METNDLTAHIIEQAIDIHRKTGPGLFESVYEEMLWYKLNQLGLFIERQKEIPVYLDGIKMGIGFRADLIIDQQVIVEIKTIETLLPVHAKQLLTYLKLTNINTGLLINFNEELLKQGIKRLKN
jgi:GxxExxY protein